MLYDTVPLLLEPAAFNAAISAFLFDSIMDRANSNSHEFF